MERMPSVQSHNFTKVPSVQKSRSTFDRSHDLKTTFDSGYLVPILVDEILPGDTLNCRMAGFGRLSTPVFPYMDNLHLETFFFFVPLRLLWDNFQRFMGEQDDPTDSIDFLVPQVTNVSLAGFTEESLQDYFALPTKVNGANLHNAFHERGYNLIWNQFFRDQNIQDSVTINKGNGPDNDTDYVLLKRGKRKDYFTGCLPFLQKGDAVNLPLGDSAPITGLGMNNQNYTAGPATAYETDGNEPVYASLSTSTNPTDYFLAEEDPDNAGYPNFRVNLEDATAATINEIREAFQIQKFLETDARGGSRYTESIKAHFGVTSPDARLQRPEFLGGGHSFINVNPVAQTSETDGTPQATLSAFATTQFKGHGFVKSFTEHGIIIGLVSVRADLTYQQGRNKMWDRQTRFDYFWPKFQNLGEQAVLSSEIYSDGGSGDASVFGYQERYAEYRYKPSQITGKFRSNTTLSLDVWHLSQEFTSRPTLNPAFIEEDPPIARVVAIDTEPQMIFNAYFTYIHARTMSTHGVPGLVDHF